MSHRTYALSGSQGNHYHGDTPAAFAGCWRIHNAIGYHKRHRVCLHEGMLEANKLAASEGMGYIVVGDMVATGKRQYIIRGESETPSRMRAMSLKVWSDRYNGGSDWEGFEPHAAARLGGDAMKVGPPDLWLLPVCPFSGRY